MAEPTVIVARPPPAAAPTVLVVAPTISPLARPDWLQRGLQLGLYEIQDRVGVGGFGALYRATRDGRDYALKIPLARPGDLEPEEREQAEERLGREVGTLLMVHHPNVVRVREFFRWPSAEEGFLCIVMDFVPGRPFYTWRREATPSLRALLTALKKLGLALDDLHAHGIHHRDVKSSNVLVTDAGEPVLVDFGIAKARSAFTVTRDAALLGTFTHWAPEYVAFYQSAAFLRGERFPYAPTTDLYALGNMAYGALCGREPHWYADAKSCSGLPGEFVDALLRDEFQPPSTWNPRLPPAVDALCLRLLAKKPADRFQSGAQLAAAIDQALATSGALDVDAPLLVPPAPTREEAEESDLELEDAAAEPAPNAVAAKPPPSLTVISPGRNKGKTPSRRVLPPAAEALPVSVVPRAPGEAAAAAAAAVVPRVFIPPSVPHAAPAFVPPEPRDVARPAPRVPPSAKRDGLGSDLLRADAQLKKNIAARKSRWLPPVLVALALIAFAGVMAMLGTTAPKPLPPHSLLSEVERSQTARATETSSSPPYQPPPSLPPPPLAAASLAATPHVPALPRPPTTRDGREVDALIQAEYGGHPIVPGASKPANVPSWMKTREASTSTSSPRARSVVPMGSEIPVRLQNPLDSRTIAGGPVVARLSRPFVLRGTVALPTGTLVYGTATTTSGGRFEVHFKSLRLPDDTALSFEGLAMDASDRKPGLAPSRRIVVPNTQPGLATRLAKGTASVLLGQVNGSAPADVARGAGETVLGSGDSTGAQASDALFLDAPTDFVVFVSAAF